MAEAASTASTDSAASPARLARRDAFLAAIGWQGARLDWLPGDASFRRYARVSSPAGRAMLMDAPPGREDVAPFVRLARHLRSLGLRAPEVLAEDADTGFLLLEDFGDATFTAILAGPGGAAEEAALYASAVDVLIALHRVPAERAAPPWLAPYDDARLMAEADLLIDWYWPAVRGRPPQPAERRAYAEAWRAPLAAVHGLPETLVLRDFHVDNLMRLSGRVGIAACGLLDFQDALRGPMAYDLMSLLEDARRDVAPALAAAMRERYEAAFPGLDRARFATAYAVLAAQRHAKVIGIFTRLCRRDGKPRYLAHIPRLWGLLEQALTKPALRPVRAWLDDAIPTSLRQVPPCPAAA